MTNEQLMNEAKQAMKKAYVPYSKFQVGCALLMNNGQVIHGANIENASYGLTNCAERSALFSAYSQGYTKTDIMKMAVVGDTDSFISPCGACRQVMNELLTADATIMLTNLKGSVKLLTKDELLPFSFTEESLK